MADTIPTTSDELRQALTDEWTAVLEDLGAERAKVEATIEESEPDLESAIIAEDMPAIKTVADTVGVEIVRAGIVIRGETADRTANFAKRLLIGLARLAAGTIGALLLVVVGGCALHRGTVPTQGPVMALLGDECAFLAECADQGMIQAAPAACDVSAAGSLAWSMADRKRIEGDVMRDQLEPVCGAVDDCTASWAALPDYRKNIYIRGCKKLQETAAAAAAGN